MKHFGFCQTLYFIENVLQASVCTSSTAVDDSVILLLLPLKL